VLHTNIRNIFTPRPGCLFVRSDYSQLEVRINAHYSQDQALISAINAGGDIHSIVAKEVFNLDCDAKDVKKLYPSKRSAAKAIVFGLAYGITKYGLSRKLKVSTEEAQSYIDAFFLKYPGIKASMDASAQCAIVHNFIPTIMGRKRHFKFIDNGAIRQAQNFPIQATASEITKAAMVEVFSRIKHRQHEIRLLMQIHDELLAECDAHLVEETKFILKDSMELGLTKFGIVTPVPLTTDPGVDYAWGYSLKEAKSDEFESLLAVRKAFDTMDEATAQAACKQHYIMFFRELKSAYPQEFVTMPGNTVQVFPNEVSPVCDPGVARFREGELDYMNHLFLRDASYANYVGKFWR
jgi:DNA polymerase I-like protein with 3'-5' exonuclease and polymerase domains